MARIRNLPSGVGIRWIFDVQFSVGPGDSNRCDDVQLVQHALNTLLAHLGLQRPNGSMITYLKRDGIFGPKTKEAILTYQKSVLASKRYITADGHVGPSSATGWTKSGSAQYSIVYLNRDHRDLYGKMMDENDFPEPLKMNVKSQKMVEN